MKYLDGYLKKLAAATPGRPQNPQNLPWDAAEANALVRSALAIDYHTDRGRSAAVGRLADAVDDAFLANDLPRLRAAVADYRAFLGAGAPGLEGLTTPFDGEEA
jgi:hypothetical protein